MIAARGRAVTAALALSASACGRIDLGSYGAVESDAGDPDPTGSLPRPEPAGSGGSPSMLGNDLGGAGGASALGGRPGNGAAGSGGSASGAGGSADGTETGGIGGTAGSGGSAGSAPEGGVATFEPPSCSAAPLSCGTEGESCCERELVPAGGFERGGPLDAGGGVAYVASFYLDKFEVTVGRFRAFIADYDGWRSQGHPFDGEGAAVLPESGWRERWNNALPETSSDLLRVVTECSGAPFSTLRDSTLYPIEVPLDNQQLPINCVSWFEAMAFCAWDGGRLPTELEWEYAAAGGDQNRPYPWGADTLTTERAEFNCGTNIEGVSNSMTISVGDGGADASVTYSVCDMTTFPAVGTKPLGAGRYQQRDLLGSISEWVLDGGALYPSTCSNCAETDVESHRMFRGGSWFDNFATFFDVTARSGADPATRWHFLGFRCARANYN